MPAITLDCLRAVLCNRTLECNDEIVNGTETRSDGSATPGLSMAKILAIKRELHYVMSSGKNRPLPAQTPSLAGKPNPSPIAPVSRVSCGSFAAAHAGKTCPRPIPSPTPTCWRRLCLWQEQEVWLKAWRACMAQLDRQGQLDWAETPDQVRGRLFADGSYAPAKKGALVSALPRRANVGSSFDFPFVFEPPRVGGFLVNRDG